MSTYVESITLSGDQKEKFLWMRKIQIIFSSKKADNNNVGYRLIIGDNTPTTNAEQKGINLVQKYNKFNANNNNLSIRIRGSKYIGTTKDKGTITIKNLEYDTIALIMAAELYKIEIKIGYGSLDNMFTVAKGEVSYISQKIHSQHDTDTYISYASEFVAAWTQARINFSLNSGVNLYSLFNYVVLQGGQSNTNISPELKKVVLENMMSEYGNGMTIVDSALSEQGEAYQIMTDSSLDGNVISITNLNEKRLIKLNLNAINIANGNPTVTSSGLQIQLFPIMNFVPGDILELDNSILDLSSGTSNAENVSNVFNANYLDKNGHYFIQQIDYTFENRGDTFIYEIQARALSLIETITGV